MINVNDLIKQELVTSNEADPHVIARVVAAKVPPRDVREILAVALTDTVRRIMWQDRNDVPPDSRPVAVGTSRKTRAAADFLRARVDTVTNGWKLLRDCTADDLLAAATYRRELANRNVAQAIRYEQLAKAVANAGATTVAGLPRDLTEQIWLGETS